MERIEEFTHEGRNFIYYDLSGFHVLEEYVELIEAAKAGIVKYPKHSVLTITNVKQIRFDSAVKTAWADWTAFNGDYVKCGAIIGADGIKKIMVNSALTISGRDNLNFFFTKEEAIDWLLKQE